MRYTVAQAAAALGCSVRTVRRRIAAGELPSVTERRGAADVTVLDAVDLAAFAEARGQTVALPRGTDGNGGQTAALGGDTEGQVPSMAAGATEGNEAQSGGTGGAQVAGEGADLGQVRALQEQVRALTDERDFLRRVLENVTKALPPGPGEPEAAQDVDRRPWWRRLLGRGTGESDG